MTLSASQLEQLDANFRAANYLSVAQLYLRENALLREPLDRRHIKARLLGHWGTVPGINLVYGHLSRLIRDSRQRILFIAGTGHGAPGVLSHLYLEGTLGEVYPQFGLGEAGLTTMVREFSWPGGMPSHLTALTPGTLHEGGELGYSLSHAFGAAMDKPDLLVACMIGDGEAETGPLAAAWQSINFMNPATDGAVLPILHLNGYKLSGPSVMARLAPEQLTAYFAGLGYEARAIAGDEPHQVHAAFAEALEWAVSEIQKRQDAARAGNYPARPNWPMLILRTPKGWTDPKMLDGKPLENTVRSHQVPIENPSSNPSHLQALERWMRSYRPEELFDSGGYPVALATAVYPEPALRMGRTPEATGGAVCVPLVMPDYSMLAVDVPAPGATTIENTAVVGRLLRDVVKANAGTRNFTWSAPMRRRPTGCRRSSRRLAARGRYRWS
jgi:xylulose-5-phosphate/fructose-6-phosphate phosphoketolase